MPTRPTSSGPTAGWRASTTLTSTRTPGPRSGSRRSPRPTTCCPILSCASRYDAFGEDFRRVPPDTDPAAWRQARTYAGAGAGAPAAAGRGAGPSGGFGAADFGDDIDIEDLLGGIFGGRGGAVGPGRLGTRSGAGLRPRGRGGGVRRGGLPRHRAQPHDQRPRWPSHARRHHPGGRGRRSADPAARPGRPGQRFGGSRRPLPGGPDRRPPALPGRGSRPARTRCRSLRGRPRWALPSPSTLLEAPPR